MGILKGKTAIVTGATRGIGRAIARAFIQEGANLAFTYRSSVSEAAQLEAELGANTLAIQADAANPAAAARVVEQTLERFGQIDIVVNNAGITQDNLLLRMTEEQFDQVLQTNLYSCFYLTKAALKPMLRERKGVFLNIASIVGVTGNAGQANYAASKGGMIAFTKSVAKEVASRNIRANVIAPGFIATEMTEQIPENELKGWLENIPLKRAGKPEEVAHLCIFLASEQATYITGQVLHIDGGMYM